MATKTNVINKAIERFELEADGVAMAMGVSTIEVGSERYRVLAAKREAWTRALKILRDLKEGKETPIY